MHFNGFRETDSFTRKPLDTSTESKIFTLNALRVLFADSMLLFRQKLGIAGITVGVIPSYAERLQQFPKLFEYCMLASAERKRHDFPRFMVDGKP